MCFYILYVCIWFRHPSDGTNHTFDKPEYNSGFGPSTVVRVAGCRERGLGFGNYGLRFGVWGSRFSDLWVSELSFGSTAIWLTRTKPLYETWGTPFSFLLRGFVSDFSGEGPSEAPVCRDKASEAWQNKQTPEEQSMNDSDWPHPRPQA